MVHLVQSLELVSCVWLELVVMCGVVLQGHLQMLQLLYKHLFHSAQLQINVLLSAIVFSVLPNGCVVFGDESIMCIVSFVGGIGL